MSNTLKKSLAVILTIVIAVLFILWYIGRNNSNSDSNEPPKSDSLVLVNKDESGLKKLSEIDSDGDGLFDWEEELWGTNPKIKDTDSDETNDGDEVDQGRDPNKPGPSDELQSIEKQTDTTNQISFNNQEQTVTDIFAKTFFSNYTNLSSPGLDPQYRTIIFQDLINDTENRVNQDFDISVNSSPNNDVSSYRSYGNSLAQVILDDLKETSVEELSLMEDYLVNNNQKSLEAIKKSAAGYENMAIKSELLSVPSNLAEKHENLVESFFQIANGLNNLVTFDEDPIKASFGVSQYETSLRAMYDSLSEIRSFLVKQGITYQENEAAYLFIYL